MKNKLTLIVTLFVALTVLVWGCKMAVWENKTDNLWWEDHGESGGWSGTAWLSEMQPNNIESVTLCAIDDYEGWGYGYQATHFRATFSGAPSLRIGIYEFDEEGASMWVDGYVSGQIVPIVMTQTPFNGISQLIFRNEGNPEQSFEVTAIEFGFQSDFPDPAKVNRHPVGGFR